MVGLASAAVVARVTGAPRGPELWIGAFIASGVPDLDIVLEWVGLKGPRYHRNASHSLFVIGALALGVWAALSFLPVELDWRVALAWLAALVSHPVVDVLTTGPSLGARGYGIGVLWPLGRRRWYMQRPLLDQTTEWESCRSLGEVWRGIKPELLLFGSVSLIVFLLTLVL